MAGTRRTASWALSVHRKMKAVWYQTTRRRLERCMKASQCILSVSERVSFWLVGACIMRTFLPGWRTGPNHLIKTCGHGILRVWPCAINKRLRRVTHSLLRVDVED